MSKVLLFNHNGFSDQNANGMTMKAFLSGWSAEEKAQFYYGTEKIDYSAAENSFRVTDMDMLRAFFGKKRRYVFQGKTSTEESPVQISSPEKPKKEIPNSLKKHKYNFALKWLREILRMLQPWGKKNFQKWVGDFAPDYIVYMVGESLSMDKIVLETVEQTKAKLVLYNGEAYRIIDLSKRKGLEKLYYKESERLYGKLNEKANIIAYNCEKLLQDYEKIYPKLCKSFVAYNTGFFDTEEYVPSERMNIVYFGNLGVGRMESLFDVADAMKKIDPRLILDIYGKASENYLPIIAEKGNINYHGMVGQEVLTDVKNNADIILCVESFNPGIVPKLRYAFSTKIAQCLCAGRCLLVYAPEETASTQYFLSTESVEVVSEPEKLEEKLKELIEKPERRKELAEKAKKAAEKNHDFKTVSKNIRNTIEGSI